MATPLKSVTRGWNELSDLKKQITIIVGILSGVGFFVKLGWVAFVEVSAIEAKLNLTDTLMIKYTKHIVLEKEIHKQLATKAYTDDSLIRAQINNNAACFSGILFPYLGIRYYKGIQLLIDKNNQFYFYNNSDGILYVVYEDKYTGVAYYYDSNNQRQVCR